MCALKIRYGKRLMLPASIAILLISLWLAGCKTAEPRLDTLPEPPMPVQPAWRPSRVSAAAVPVEKSVTLEFNASPDSRVIGYRIYYGLGAMTNVVDLGNALTGTIPGLTPLQTYHFTATAYTGTGLESGPSNEVIYQVPDVTVRIILWTAVTVNGPWIGIVTNTIPATNAQQMFKQSITLIP